MQKWSHRAIGAILFVAGTVSANAQVASPDGRNVVNVIVQDGGVFWTFARDGRNLFLPSEKRFAPKREVLEWRLERLRRAA